MKNILFILLFSPILSNAQLVRTTPSGVNPLTESTYVNSPTESVAQTFTGAVTLAGSSLTVTGSAFSVGGSALVVSGGKVGIGTNAPDRAFSVFMASGSYANFGSTVAAGHNSGILLGYFDPTAPLSYNKAGIIFKRSGVSGEGSLNIALNNVNDPSNATIDNATATFLPDGNVAMRTTAAKLVMVSPDGTCSACGPDNSDVWACSSVACP